MAAYDVLALDLDGTTLTSSREILPVVRDAIRRIRHQVMVLLVTGRHHTAAYPYYQALQLETPIISCNGTYVYDYQRQQILAENAIPHVQAAQFIALAQQHHLNLVMYVTDRMTFSKTQPIQYMTVLEQWARQFPPSSRPRIERIDDFYAEMQRHQYVWKFVIEGEIADVEFFAGLPYIRDHFTGERSWSNRIDFSNKGNTKGARLKEFLQQHEIDPRRMIAIGDSDNDISMLQLAGLGVAMANADAAVKQAADCITQDTNDGLGISQIISDYFAD
jgi:Cof subfamily protein (haloacid dehalogenase superfamily)